MKVGFFGLGKLGLQVLLSAGSRGNNNVIGYYLSEKEKDILKAKLWAIPSVINWLR